MTHPLDERHYIFGTQAQELNATKEVKMRLPINQLIRLHGLKLLSGQNISDTVAKALSAYFETLEAEKQAARAAVPS